MFCKAYGAKRTCLKTVDDALIVAFYKNKGSKSDCVNYRGISLSSVTGKVFARILLNRLLTVFERSLPEAQCGFRPECSTVDKIFVVSQVKGKCIEPNEALYAVFIDLTKAFDKVNREASGRSWRDMAAQRSS